MPKPRAKPKPKPTPAKKPAAKRKPPAVRKGDAVRVVSGKLKGKAGTLVDVESGTYGVIKVPSGKFEVVALKDLAK